MDRGALDRAGEWGLEELVTLTGRLLASADLVQADGRVTAAPDARAIRYYQHLGMVDAPTRYEGRRAVYGYRHALQVLAIKRLQAEGLSLAQVQRALAGRSTGELERALPRPGVAVPAPGQTPPHDGPPADRMPLDPRRLIAREIVAGVVVLIDPSQVKNPELVVDTLRAALDAGASRSAGGQAS